MRMIQHSIRRSFSRALRLPGSPARTRYGKTGLASCLVLALALALVSPLPANASPSVNALELVLDVLDSVEKGLDASSDATSSWPAISSEDAVAKAQQGVQDKALFVARVEGELLAAGFDGSLLLPHWERESYLAASLLWSLSPSPRLQERAKANLLDTNRAPGRRLDTLEDTVDVLYSIADDVCYAVEKRHFSRAPHTLNGRLALFETLSPYLPFVGDNLEKLQEVEEHGPHNTEAALLALWQLREQPEDLAALFDALTNTGISDTRRQVIARRIADNPENGAALLDEMLTELRRESIYDISNLVEFDLESIGLPYAALFPDTDEKSGNACINAEKAIPLTASGPQTGLVSVKELSELVPAALLEDLRDLGYDARAPELPLNKEGETIYALVGSNQQDAIPVFAGSVLGELAAYGPHILPYTDETAYYFALFLDRGRSVPLFAAEGTPEDVAAHLASLSVMVAERERSLYGPFEAYTIRPAEEALQAIGTVSISADEYPEDQPGKLPRMTRLADPLFLATLAQQADAAGLARLMGPIRAIWTPAPVSVNVPGDDSAAQDAPFWSELRYAPTEAPAVATLGQTPLLSLDVPALEALRAAHVRDIRAHTEGALSHDACGDKADPACAETLASLRGGVAAAYWGLEQLGFKAPAELHGISYALVQFRDDADKSAAIFALLLDQSKDSVQKYRDVTDLLKAEIRVTAEPSATPATPENAVPSAKPGKADKAAGVSGQPGQPGSSDPSPNTGQGQSRYGSWDDTVTGNGK
ncbi:hypothetical protein LJC23_01745 [Desulfovibrio sp. OttesenSCG-928-I05]|nr:hypothetical protein [Desulfovibrio sp. OttesenSCG-928-I05]